MLPGEDVKRVLAAALRNGGNLAAVYLEDTEALQLRLDDQHLETATQGNDIGGGVRVFYGNTAAYAYTDDLSIDSLLEAVQAAARGTNEPHVTIDHDQCRRRPLPLSTIRWPPRGC